MRISAVVKSDGWPVIEVTLDHRVGRNGSILQIALTRVSTDDHADLRHWIAMNYVVGNSVQSASGPIVLPKIRMKAPISNIADDGGRVRGRRSLGNVLVPRIVRGEEICSQQWSGSRWDRHRQEPYEYESECSRQCWLALVAPAIQARLGEHDRMTALICGACLKRGVHEAIFA